MEVTTSIREDDGKTEVTVELTAEEVKKHVDAFFKELAKNRIPGFRPGKAPRKVLEQNFGGHDAVYAQIASDMVNDEAPRAVDSEDVLFITDPEFDELPELKDGESFTFKLNGKVKPEVELLTYDPVEIEMPPEQATETEIQTQLDALRAYYYSFEDVPEDTPAAEGNYVMASLESTADGAEVEGLNNENRLIEIGGDVFPEELTEQFVGMKAGDTKEFDWENDGKTVHTKATVSKVQTKKIPELDDAFAKQVGFDSLDKLREEITEQLNSTKEQQLPDLKERRCVEELAKRIHGEVSTAYVNFSREDILRDFFNGLQRQGMTFDQFLQQRGITADDFQKDLDEEAKENAEQSLALDALFRERGMELTDEDLDKEFALTEDPAGTRKRWEESGRMSVLREALRRQKAAEWLEETAVVTVVEGDGSDDEEEAEE